MEQQEHLEKDARIVDSKSEHVAASSTTYLIADTKCRGQMRPSTSLHNCSARLTQGPDGHTLSQEEVPYPRPNTFWEECIAVTTMLLCFG